MHDHTLHAVCETLRNESVVDFVRASVKAGYREVLSAPAGQIDDLVETAFARLVNSQREAMDHLQLVEATADLLENVFKKGDAAFWFNRSYHEYKTRTKPETDFRQLREMIVGKRVLDYGCGSGYLAARLARGGYDVFTTDVLDYRYDEARHLPFVQMTSPTDIAYPDDSVETALVQAVLHHIAPDRLPDVIQRLAHIASHVLIKEDSYDLPGNLPGLGETLNAQPLLRTFVQMPTIMQHQTLILIDFFANAIAQGIPEMNMPFAFRSVMEWQSILEKNGLRVSRILVAGFEPGRAHKSCHVWFVCDRL